ncbi:tyrosine-type recombinase/integrase [Azospirillum oryzae]|uniref:tyrosine-type recombinase/integrase n=1 Tax=Azospirillum oryzae TaxID=286727 RepID=UPI001AC00967|nr:site-specific integrase [Azospirillum oryzae]
MSNGIDPAAEEKAQRAQAYTVLDLCKRYLEEHVDVKNRTSTAKGFRRLVDKHVKPVLGELAVSAVTRADISKLHHDMRATPRQANQTLAVMSKMFHLAEVWGFRPDEPNPCRKIERYKEAKRERFLSEGELATLGAVLSEREPTELPGVINGIRLLLLTGCRLGEVVGLRWDEVDLTAGALIIPEEKGKAGARVHPIGAQTIAFLNELPRAGEWVLFGRDPKESLSKNTMENAWRRIREKAKLDDMRLHDLRHTVGTYAGQTGANAFLVRDKLGHKTLAMTSRYVNRDADPLRTLSDKVENRITAALNSQKGNPKAEESNVISLTTRHA